MSRSTPLHEVHEALGATLTDFAGWLMPLRYGSESVEHNAVRTAAGLFDLSHMGEIFVTGPQAGEALDHALVGWLSALDTGRARYTMIVDGDGHVLDDLIVYRLAPEEFLVVANAANYPMVARELTERAGAYDARVEDRSESFALVAVQGPNSAEILAKLTEADLDGLKYYAGLPATVAGFEALIARTGYTGEDGFELFVRNEDAVPLWNALSEAGAGLGLRPAGLSARDTLRLEAGMPLYGNELTAEQTPFDAGLGRVVRLDKPGDFVGRAALAVRAAQDQEAGPGADTRRLVGLVARGRRVPRHGYPVTRDGVVVGEVTSGAPSQSLGKPIAMAYVSRGAVEAGGLAVDIRGSHEPVDVVDLPFYRRSK
ncbi:glycine cleavage system aminomethyltransferase GcvT [Planotetraspora kaengkrachanensis]|uniref:Aminomethyltransferase n=1 Tax=Planotetraspora kaengkrachanensis TaxID=575193 RepID=A0A8J3PVN7_9ACTN|nr:glycine cleavage system aminomethyltransferase GcvT [Planotetraspora kaengkrachanensis]GIG81786.1 aminomethyltransferase [Planotetraspora kaengkrachanensis]